jgi:hypothetical protein
LHGSTSLPDPSLDLLETEYIIRIGVEIAEVVAIVTVLEGGSIGELYDPLSFCDICRALGSIAPEGIIGGGEAFSHSSELFIRLRVFYPYLGLYESSE